MSGPPATPGTVVVLASRNPGKIAELSRIVAGAGLPVQVTGVSQYPGVPDVAEAGASFLENAILKAVSVAAATGRPAIADDSGLAVEALNGMPGIFSARWAGRHGDDEANLVLLLSQLREVPDERRDASFVCAAAAALPDGTLATSQATMPGRLIRSRRGDGGFGYDPIFIPAGYTRTTAELSPAEKDAISHRGQALRALMPALRKLLA